MLTFLFIVLMLGVFGKLLVFAIKATWSITKIIVNIGNAPCCLDCKNKATWSITKIIVNIVFLPLVIIGLFVSGLAYAALIVLAIVGIVSLIKDHM